jgi:ACS family sodium-dependent inorganic phosphate cotransporter-like MFS transporter 6/7/8
LIAAAYPANKLFGLAIGASSFLNLFVAASYEHPQVLIIIKVLQGLVEVDCRRCETPIICAL